MVVVDRYFAIDMGLRDCRSETLQYGFPSVESLTLTISYFTDMLWASQVSGQGRARPHGNHISYCSIWYLTEGLRTPPRRSIDAISVASDPNPHTMWLLWPLPALMSPTSAEDKGWVRTGTPQQLCSPSICRPVLSACIRHKLCPTERNELSRVPTGRTPCQCRDVSTEPRESTGHPSSYSVYPFVCDLGLAHALASFSSPMAGSMRSHPGPYLEVILMALAQIRLGPSPSGHGHGPPWNGTLPHSSWRRTKKERISGVINYVRSIPTH